MSQLFKLIGIIYFMTLAFNYAKNFYFMGNIILLLQGLLVLAISFSFIFQVKSKYVDLSAKALIITLVHLSLPLLMVSEINSNGYLPKIGKILIILGLTVSCLSVINLWESFGAVPALRKIKTEGLYSFVRHPIYTGYIISSVGLIVVTPSLRNLILFTLFLIMTVFRLTKEEQALSFNNDDYKKYKSLVRYRIVPCIY